LSCEDRGLGTSGFWFWKLKTRVVFDNVVLSINDWLVSNQVAVPGY